MRYADFDALRERSGLTWPELQDLLGLSRTSRYAWYQRDRVPTYALLAVAAHEQLSPRQRGRLKARVRDLADERGVAVPELDAALTRDPPSPAP